MEEIKDSKEISETNTSGTPTEEKCEFLKCTPKENGVSESENFENEDEGAIGVARETDVLDKSVCGRIFAKQNEDGNWLLRWDVERRSCEDFIVLCYEGK